MHQITDAVTPHSDDLDARMAKYLVSMLIRTVCVVLVLVVDGWLRWVFAAGAVALPYVAVILANNTGRRRRGRASFGRPATEAGALGPAARPATTDRRAGDPPPIVLTGVVQPPRDDPTAGPDPLRDSA